MKEFKYTIDGKEYKVEIGEINAENVAEVSVNGEQYAVQLLRLHFQEPSHLLR